MLRRKDDGNIPWGADYLPTSPCLASTLPISPDAACSGYTVVVVVVMSVVRLSLSGKGGSVPTNVLAISIVVFTLSMQRFRLGPEATAENKRTEAFVRVSEWSSCPTSLSPDRPPSQVVPFGTDQHRPTYIVVVHVYISSCMFT